MIIDCYTQALPQKATQWIPGAIRQPARSMLKPLSQSYHRSAPFFRHFPKPLQLTFEEISSWTMMPHLLFESTLNDLKESMSTENVDHALIAPVLPLTDQESFIRLCRENKKIFPILNFNPGISQMNYLTQSYKNLGAKGIKVHPALEKISLDDPHYRKILESAEKANLPIFVETSLFLSRFACKKPEFNQARYYIPWIKNHPELQFVFPHMNLSDPEIAIEITEKFQNVHLTTSWQPTETIAEAIRRIGSDRILFSSDWPFGGNNLEIGIQRILNPLISKEDAEKILGKNSLKIFDLVK